MVQLILFYHCTPCRKRKRERDNTDTEGKGDLHKNTRVENIKDKDGI